MDPGYADSGARRFFAELKTWSGSSYRGFHAALAGLPKRTQRLGQIMRRDCQGHALTLQWMRVESAGCALSGIEE